MIKPRELRDIFWPPLTFDKHVSFYIYSEYLNFSLAELVDGLLWITHHAESLSLMCIQNDCDYELSFKHCIKEVKIEHSSECPRTACIDDTNGYSSKNGHIMEKIDDL